ncbi:glycosyltransferase [Rhodobacter sp. NSM]|uniref:glycosyltransferase n=1 Tax=Rhodobacter sp. NSM TaxID=3457501 RepID=UPI003FD63599
MFELPPARAVPLCWFPDYAETNPYQTLLYDGLGPMFSPQAATLAETLDRQADVPGGRMIFHLHWEHAVLLQGKAEPFLDDLDKFRARGGRVVWTLHNLEPRDARLAGAMEDLRSGLVLLADLIHLHSLPAVVAAREALRLPPGRIRIIPHGGYEGAYPVAGREAARAALGLADARMVVLLPGRLAAYKQPAALVAAFSRVAGPHDRLLLAGQAPLDLLQGAPEDPRVAVLPDFASPEQVSQFHAAADIVALPYARSLTSGSAVLAQTLGRGVLGPDLPGLRDVVEQGRTGVLHDPRRPLDEVLAEALAEGPDRWAERGAAALALAPARDRRIVSAMWRDLFSALLVHAAPGRIGEVS